ncbi:MAG: DEAD/DEAH box helicase family protein [Methylobacter sp.]|uniref:DEAD/DEAH box helicase family protein n=1 Tax=Methylobacter sp. TaxID=2051955 RepID=UPI0025F7A887|nr:DEAD/DEAH box helicase family protein [Methylobacter sp.]MCK9619116.1 DEAD/DEAH box helicase family protein [Methylobacter sp.]
MSRTYQTQVINQLVVFFKEYETIQGLGLVSMPTGSGKTYTAMLAIRHFIEEHPENKVIWIAPEKELLAQAHNTYKKVFGSIDGLRWIGAKHAKLRHLNSDMNGQLFLVTTQSWHNPRNRAPIEQYRKRMLVVCDEAHWGVNARMFATIAQFCREGTAGVPMVGLTATPRIPQQIPHTLISNISFAALVHTGYLAQPYIHKIPTGVQWNPIFDSRNQLSQASLRELNTVARNKIIVKTVRAVLRDPKRKGILFAIDVAHAEQLYSRLASRVLTSVVHGKRKDNDAMIECYRNGHTQLLILVDKLTMGFDVPAITDVFLARPCDSEVRIAQMAGRGARIIPGKKDRFHVYDFFDVIDASKAQKIFHSLDYFADAAVIRPTAHRYPEQPNSILLDERFSHFAGLSIIENMTFGVELEITSPNEVPLFGTQQWNKGAELLIRTLSVAIGPEQVYQKGLNYHQSARVGANTLWRVESDSSAGWEVISPILCGVDDVLQLIKVCAALEACIDDYHDLFHINTRCGFHLTLATDLKTRAKRQRMIARLSRLEPGLFTLVAPSRLHPIDETTSQYQRGQYNWYCMPISVNQSALQRMVDFSLAFDEEDDEFSRYQSFNFTQFEHGAHLIEVRMHNGTVNENNIIPWISLWMAITTKCQRSGSMEFNQAGLFKPTTPASSEDILALLDNEGIPIEPRLRTFLFNRRKQLSWRWRRVLPNKCEQWDDASFYEESQYNV